MSSTEENFTSNYRELLELVYFLQRFRCYLEGSYFEVLTDNQVLYNFLTKPKLGRREAHWLDLFAEFNLDKISLVKGSIHVLGDAISRIPTQDHYCIGHTMVSFPTIKDSFLENYSNDQLFGPIYKALDGKFPSSTIEADRVR